MIINGTNNEYDVKDIPMKQTLPSREPEANSAMALDTTTNKMYDIIETPANSLGLKNDFNFYLGNINLNYKFAAKDDRHFQDKLVEKHWYT